MHPWCTLDAVGIPAALRLDAAIGTVCPHCGETLKVVVADGEASADMALQLFCPTSPCSDVRAEFCTRANLFCSAGHLDAWRAANRDVEGQSLDLAETVALGRAMWARHGSY